MPWAVCPLHTAARPNFEASVVISIPGLSMVMFLHALGRLVT